MYAREDHLAHWQEDRARGGKSAYEVAASKAAGLAGLDLSGEQEETAGSAMHYGIGMGSTALYAAVRRHIPAPAVVQGLGFGAALWLIADEGANPSWDPRPVPERSRGRRTPGAWPPIWCSAWWLRGCCRWPTGCSTPDDHASRRRMGLDAKCDRGGGTCTRIPPALYLRLAGNSAASHDWPQQPSSGSSVIACQRAPATGSSVRGSGPGSAYAAATPEEQRRASALGSTLGRRSQTVFGACALRSAIPTHS